MNDKEALKLALEALETCYAGDYSTGHVIDPSFDEDAVKEAIISIKEALAQPEQESPMSEPNRAIAYAASGKLHELGYRYLNGEWVKPKEPEQEPVVTDAMVEAAVKAFWGYENSKVCRTAYRLAIKATLQEKFCDNNCVWTDHHPDCKLAKPEPEWYHIIDVHGCNRFYHKTEDCPYECRTPLYTTPPQRTWVPLMIENIVALFPNEFLHSTYDTEKLISDVRIVEAKLKEKNTNA